MSKQKPTEAPQIVDGTVKLSEIRPSPTNQRKKLTDEEKPGDDLSARPKS